MGFNETYREAKEMRTWCRDEKTQEEFFRRYRLTILKLANLAVKNGVRDTVDELVQKGLIALFMATENYASYISAGRKVRFKTYACNWIKEAMGGDNSADSYAESLDQLIEGVEGDGMALHELIALDEPRPDRQLENKELWQAVNVLPPNQRLVIIMRYKEDMTLAAVGEQMGGITRERVRQIEAKALKELRKHLSFTSPFLDKAA